MVGNYINIRIALASYTLGNLPISEFPQIALKMMDNGYSSESLDILGGINSKTTSSTIIRYLEESIEQLGIKKENQYDSFIVLSQYYSQKILKSEEDVIDGVLKIKNQYIDNCNYIPDSKIFHLDGIKFNKLAECITLYDDLVEMEWSSPYIIEKQELRKSLFNELKKWTEGFLNPAIKDINAKNYNIELDEFCPCCYFNTFSESERLQFFICPICYWEDDPVAFYNPFYTGGANDLNLIQARIKYARTGLILNDMNYSRKTIS